MPPQNQSADGSPSESIGPPIDSKPWIDKVLADKILAHPHPDAQKQYDHVEDFLEEYRESLDEDQLSAIKDEMVRCLREKERSRKNANHEHRLNAIAKYNATNRAVSSRATNRVISIDPTLPTTQQSKIGELCKRLPPDVRI